MAADAQRAAGAMPTARPFTRTERRRVPAPPLAVGVACDVSGSMSSFTGPVASTAWVLARATASLPAARTATVTCGRQVRPVTYPGAVPAQVSEFRAADKYEDFTRAVNALDGALGLSRPGSTRILVIVSDGRYKGTQHADGQKLITRLVASGRSCWAQFNFRDTLQQRHLHVNDRHCELLVFRNSMTTKTAVPKGTTVHCS